MIDRSPGQTSSTTSRATPRHLSSRSSGSHLRKCLKASVAFLLATPVWGQSTDQLPSQAPPNKLISLQASPPHLTQQGVTILLRLTSLTGNEVEVATPAWHEGWAVFTASGETCDGNHIDSQSLPYVSSDGHIAGPRGTSAGISAPELVPIVIHCDIQRREEISLNMILYVKSDSTWRPQHFALTQQVVQ